MNNEKLKEVIEKLRSQNVTSILNYEIANILESIFDTEEEVKKEPKQRYFKLIGGELFSYKIGTIYKEDYTIQKYVMAVPHLWFEVSKEEYYKQELLEEAKRRYPISTKFKSLLSGHEFVSKGAFCIENNNTIIAVKEGGVVYYNGQWSEIVEENTLVKDDTLPDLDNFYGFKFDFGFYKIHKHIKVSGISAKENSVYSKMYDTGQECKEALYDYIWDNHKTTAKEFSELDNSWGESYGWKEFYCEQIIKKKQL